LAGEEAVSLLAAGHFFHWIKLCTYELNSGVKKIVSLDRHRQAHGLGAITCGVVGSQPVPIHGVPLSARSG
ncbi:MAG: hypothetical protein AB2807_11425, partial [Candidatus Sedimenticola endophacoides]